MIPFLEPGACSEKEFKEHKEVISAEKQMVGDQTAHLPGHYHTGPPLQTQCGQRTSQAASLCFPSAPLRSQQSTHIATATTGLAMLLAAPGASCTRATWGLADLSGKPSFCCQWQRPTAICFPARAPSASLWPSKQGRYPQPHVRCIGESFGSSAPAGAPRAGKKLSVGRVRQALKFPYEPCSSQRWKVSRNKKVSHPVPLLHLLARKLRAAASFRAAHDTTPTTSEAQRGAPPDHPEAPRYQPDASHRGADLGADRSNPSLEFCGQQGLMLHKQISSSSG